MNRMHKHVCCNEDIYNELFDLLSSARRLYVEKVLNGNMRPDHFVELFCDIHHFIDCDRPCCKNVHRMNLRIVRTLFLLNKDLFDVHLRKEPFTLRECSDLVSQYLTEVPARRSDSPPPLPLGRFTEEQISHFAEIAHDNRLFLLFDGMDAKTAIAGLLHCKRGFSVKVRNIRNIVVFFDALLAHNLIIYNWQSAMEKGRFLLSPKSNEPITSSTLSSALNKARTSSTVTQLNIRKAVFEMQEGNKTDNQTNKGREKE